MEGSPIDGANTGIGDVNGMQTRLDIDQTQAKGY